MVPQDLKGHERPEEVTGAQDLEPIRIKERAPTPACTTPPFYMKRPQKLLEDPQLELT